MQIPFKMFFHIAQLNHWEDIVREQLQQVVKSGFYNECDLVYVGVLGNDLEKVKEIFADEKVYRAEFYHHIDIKRYEFHTLRILKKVCNESPLFYGAYIHDKACSYPTDPNKNAGKVWRDYLMHWTIGEWRQNYKALNMKFLGYDLCAIKIIPARVSPSNRTHSSGNMWMFNSEYIRSLVEIDELDTANRFEAEMWAFSGQPIIYMPCNLFIDYLNRQKSYEDFVNNYPEYKDHCLFK